MTDIYNFSESELLLFFLVMIRISTFVATWPVFGIQTVPTSVKILFALGFTMMVFPTLSFTADQKLAVGQSLLMMSVKEAALGIFMGALSRFFFFAFQIAGEIVSLSVGLSSAQMFNPSLGGQTSALEQFYLAFATLFYLAVNGHHYLLSGLVESFHTVPISAELLKTHDMGNISLFVKEVVEIGLKFSAPILVSILVINIVMGVVGKVVPQMNVLVTSFPINILVGFVVLFITLPLMLDEMGDFLELATTRVFQMVKTF
jgi:flagellar biosynthetic protein FliR